jgi:hypothetical protein
MNKNPRDKLGRFVKGIIPDNKGKKTGKHSWNYSGLDKLQCKECGVHITKNSKLGFCKSCSHKGKRNINYGGFSELHCKNISKARSGCNSPFKGHQHTVENKQKMSETRKGIKRPENCGRNNPMFGKVPNWKRIKYKGVWMRSTWEVAYANYLDKNKIKWLYEPKTFDLGNSTYTPDFYLPETDTYIEIKGFITVEFKRKYRIFKKKFKTIKLRVIKEKQLKKERII